MLELRRATQARANLAEVLRETPHADPDFSALLAAVRDSRLFSVPEIAELVGLGKSRTYELLAQADRGR